MNRPERHRRHHHRVGHLWLNLKKLVSIEFSPGRDQTAPRLIVNLDGGVQHQFTYSDAESMWREWHELMEAM